MRVVTFVLVLVLVLLGCGGLATPPPPPEAPAPVVEESRERLLPPLPDRGEDRPPDCLLVVEGLSPLFVLHQPEGRRPASFEVKKGAAVERVVLTDGVVVRLQRWGCAHYAETWDIVPLPDGADPRQFAIDTIARIRTREGTPPIVDTLRRATNLGSNGSLPCGDAQCRVSAADGVVTVEYDFPL